MSIFKHSRALLSLTFIIVSFLSAADEIHKYNIESGIILYEISGGAQLTKETNLSIKGSLKLRFKEWGDIKLEEENVVVLTSGAIRDRQESKRLEKEINDKIIIVDYKNNKLLERKKNDTISNIVEETEGLLQKGEDVVSGYPCKVWASKGLKKCIYKGIVLREEYYIFGLNYKKFATQVVFDINPSNKNCVVPDYPVHKFGLLKDNIKIKNSAKTENFCKMLKDLPLNIKKEKRIFSKIDLRDKERIKFINHITKDIFLRQKQRLPKLLHMLKEERICLQKAENTLEANYCLESLSELKMQFGNVQDNYIILRNEKKKEKLLDSIEDKLIYIQSRTPCINRAKNITDLSACMK